MLRGLGFSHLEGDAGDHGIDEAGEAIVVFCCVIQNGINSTAIGVLEAAAQCIGEQAFGKAFQKIVTTIGAEDAGEVVCGFKFLLIWL